MTVKEAVLEAEVSDLRKRVGDLQSQIDTIVNEDLCKFTDHNGRIWYRWDEWDDD